jgi:hypothetical protein
MATESKNPNAAFIDGLEKFAEASRFGFTASRLAMVGIGTLAAAGFFYFWDEERRNVFLRALSETTDGLAPWFNFKAPGSGDEATTASAQEASGLRGASPSNDTDEVPSGAHSG